MFLRKDYMFFLNAYKNSYKLNLLLLKLTLKKKCENNFYSFLSVVLPEAQILDNIWTIIIQ